MRTTLLGLLGSLVCGLAAMAQPVTPPTPTTPAQPPPPPVNPYTPQPVFGSSFEFIPATAPAPKPGTVEEAIALALKNHPDVKLAEAKRMVADAELEQAKLIVTQKVTAAYAKVQLAKLRVDVAEKEFARISETFRKGTISEQERAASEAALRTAKADLDAATAELQSARGGAAKTAGKVVNTYGFDDKDLYDRLHTYGTLSLSAGTLNLTTHRPEPGSVSEKLRALIEKKIKLDLKSGTLAEVFDALMKASGEQGVTVRLPGLAAKDADGPRVGPLKGEQTFNAWVQLIMDDLAAAAGEPGGWAKQIKYEVYVRDYGLLVTSIHTAPQGAVTLTQFAKQVLVEPTAKKPEEPKKP